MNKITTCMALILLLQAGGVMAAGPTSADALQELKFRNAVPETRYKAGAEDLAALEAMEKAEEGGAFDLLAQKRKSIPPGFYKERSGRRVMTLQGFMDYRARLTRDAMKFFQDKNMTWNEILGLRDLKGAPAVGEFNQLSYAGMQMYRDAAGGEKTWLLPGEALPYSSMSPEDKRCAKLLKGGFMEISQPEYLWLLKTTRCSEETLHGDYDIITVKYKKISSRYFIKPPPPGIKNIVFFYIAKYRNGNTEESGEVSTGFFGTGSVAARHLCTGDGKTWRGD